MKNNINTVTNKYKTYPNITGSRIAEGGLRLNNQLKISQKNFPLVTIITVSLNSEKTIEQCINSVLNQSYKNIEYIIIDGLSSDKTIEIVKKYENKIDYYISEADNGLYNAMNKGIELSSGDFILILNSDDWYCEDCVDKLISAKKNGYGDIISSLAMKIDFNDKKITPMKGIPFDKSIFIRMVTRHETMLIPNKIYNKAGFYDENFSIIADWEFTIRLFKMGYTVHEIQLPLLNFRFTGISNSGIPKLVEERKKLIKREFPFLSKDDIDYLSHRENHTFKGIENLAIKYIQEDFFVKSLKCYAEEMNNSSWHNGFKDNLKWTLQSNKIFHKKISKNKNSNIYFWQHCTEYIKNIRNGSIENSIESLKNAELHINENINSTYIQQRRKEYLDKLKSFSKKENFNNLNNFIINVDPAKEDLYSKDKSFFEKYGYYKTIDFSNMFLQKEKKEDFGIIVFGHTRIDTLKVVLESLNYQNALKDTEVWLDGDQGKSNIREKIQKTKDLINKYPVKSVRTQLANFGFRKMLILSLVEMCNRYRDILILEDDCFPTRDAISIFKDELNFIRNKNNFFSVYGHHFLIDIEKTGKCPRFQGWGWATTSEKLEPILKQLMNCYLMTEYEYLDFIKKSFTPEIRQRIEITPPRQPSDTLERFFAWDETLCLLTALNNQQHRPTAKRTIYNCGMGNDSTHFKLNNFFRNPAFNLITPDEVWNYF